MSDNTEALLARIKQLEDQNKQFKEENFNLKKNTQRSSGPAALHTHVFEIERQNEDNNEKIPPSKEADIGGLRFSVRMKEHRAKENYHKFMAVATLHVSNNNADHKFVLATMELKERGVRHGYSNEPAGPYERPLCKPTTQQLFVHNKEVVGYSKLKTMHRPIGKKYVVHLTVAVQDIDPVEIDDDSAAIVVVGDDRLPVFLDDDPPEFREFRVSAPYLAMHSRFFRAYFKAPMKEKEEGRFPIRDKDITPDDFQELLDVIYPTSKPICAQNFEMLLKLASRFEMPELTRRIELFMIDFDRNELSRATVFRIATDEYPLELVQSTLFHRWSDSSLLQNELLTTEEYQKLEKETKTLVNQKFAEACIEKPGQWGAAKRSDSDGKGGFCSGRGGFGGGRGGGYGGGFGDRRSASPPGRGRRDSGGFGAGGGFGDRRSPARRDRFEFEGMEDEW